MESILAVKKEEDKLKSKYASYRSSSTQNLDDLIEEINLFKQSLNEVTESDSYLTPLQTHLLAATAKKVKDVTKKVSLEHKELHVYVSKIGKVIDRNFSSDFSGLTQGEIFNDESRKLLNEAIAEHLLRQGRVDIAENFIKESGLVIEAHHKDSFTNLNYMLNEIKDKRLDSALLWACQHHDELILKKSCLEFKLHKLTFLGLLERQRHKEALDYSKIFASFSEHADEIKRLMGCFAFLNRGIENSPYADLFDSASLVDVSDHLAKDVCSLLGLSNQSPLEVSLTAGCIALPTLLQIRQVMQQRQVEGIWSTKEELPVEINLGRELQFHSVFACPILRQQCGQSNPPMRLVCGHVISKDATQRLTHGNKLKCPYCPVEMDPREAKKIYF
ncbi:E3 ubiquitin-protein ligase RMND5A isoform X1 [Hydra vulgaris]|nr:E3 ubiquitin-protein ligase RMND5A [Hydra vulgaris]